MAFERLKQRMGELCGVAPPGEVTRIEVIETDGAGRVYAKFGAKVELSYQDEGRTLKVLVARRKNVASRAP